MANLSFPRVMRVGGGALNELPDALRSCGFSRPVILTDPFMQNCGMLDRLISILGKAGIQVRVFSAVIADPTVASIKAAVAFMAEGDHDSVIGFGGGSSIDSAKAAAVLATRGGQMRDLAAPHLEERPGLPIVAIPTTAGTGSEATRVTIITDETTDEKMLCAGMAYMPTLAIVDYELTMTMPMRLTADTGIDSLTHAIEAYVSQKANPLSDTLAISAMGRIWPNLRRVCNAPDDREARSQMMLGALQAGIAFSNASVALVHGMSRPIGAHFHVAHGLSNAMLLPAITAWSAPGAPERYAQCARAMGIASAGEADQVAIASLIAALRDVNRDLRVPTPKIYGLDEGRWHDLIPQMAKQALASGSPANNPRVPVASDIEQLYRDVWA